MGSVGPIPEMLERIISGGQTGADQAALAVAIDYGVSTGGWAPKGWLTESGPNYNLEPFYGLKECDLPGYPARTELNVQDSDGTVLFGDVRSAGSKLAIGWAKAFHKPFLINPTPEDLATWIDNQGIKTLNVGGNRASKNSMVYTLTYSTLAKTIEILRQPLIELP